MRCPVCSGELNRVVKGVDGRGCAKCGHFAYMKEPVIEVPEMSDDELSEAVADIDSADGEVAVDLADVDSGELVEPAEAKSVKKSKKGKGKKK